MMDKLNGITFQMEKHGVHFEGLMGYEVGKDGVGEITVVENRYYVIYHLIALFPCGVWLGIFMMEHLSKILQDSLDPSRRNTK